MVGEGWLTTGGADATPSAEDPGSATAAVDEDEEDGAGDKRTAAFMRGADTDGELPPVRRETGAGAAVNAKASPEEAGGGRLSTLETCR